MLKYFTFISCIACFTLLACSTPSNQQAKELTWDYLRANQDPVLDRNVQPILNQYQAILKGLMLEDTAFIHIQSKDLMQMSDSILLLKLGKDSTIQKIWADGISNIQAELAALNLATDPKELKISVHMTGLQILNLLAQIGYQAHTIYIFQVKDIDFEDGLSWFSIQKFSRDPYHNAQRNELSATQVLQEAHIQ